MHSVLLLSRFQFALTIMFHYLFPPLSIGIGLILVIMEGLYLKTKNPMYETMARFWTKIFGVNFALGVATGLVMEFEFGTNWATYSRYVGDIFGSALASEGIFAFFLESGFLAVLVFGWDRVSPKMHFFSTLMVSLGSMFSAVWIVIANSWQQTPAGFHIVGTGLAARAQITDFWAMVFNPSSMTRLGHVMLGAYLQGAFFVMSVAAYYILKRRHQDFARRSFTIALWVAGIVSLVQLFSGHHQAVSVSEYQPAKLAAFEGHYKTGTGGTDLYLFGIPDSTKEIVHGVAVPGMLSLLVHGNFHEPVIGLDHFPEADRPPVAVPFFTYHLMIALGTGFIALTMTAFYFLKRGTLFEQRWLMHVFVYAVVGPFLANEAGWVSAEVGRQPWVVYGLLRTSDALSRVVAANQVLGSIVMFAVMYSLLFAVWVYVLNAKIQHGPEDAHPPENTSSDGLLKAAGALVKHDDSLTDTHE